MDYTSCIKNAVGVMAVTLRNAEENAAVPAKPQSRATVAGASPKIIAAKPVKVNPSDQSHFLVAFTQESKTLANFFALP